MLNRFNGGYYGHQYQTNDYYSSNEAAYAHADHPSRYHYSQRRYNSHQHQQTSTYSEGRFHDQPNRFAGPSRNRYHQSVSRSTAYGLDNVRVLNGSPLREIGEGEGDRMDDVPPPALATTTTSAPLSRPQTPPRPPSPDYLTITEEHPAELPSPTAARKLLVLDLNGTLCLRMARRRMKQKGRDQDGDKDIDTVDASLEHGSEPQIQGQAQNLRTVHPRPYMDVFRSFLFAKETRKWLDVMVWSSARPHNVDNMVHQCFGSDRGRMIAVWARDTLGLSVESYNTKVQTYKDLTKPWEKVTSLIAQNENGPMSNASEASSSTERSHSNRTKKSKQDRATSPELQQERAVHSARTTILLDDSPLKAVRQPYNHLCICEYTASHRQLDLASFTFETRQATTAMAASSGSTDADLVNGVGEGEDRVNEAVMATEGQEHENEQEKIGQAIEQGSPGSRKRKREMKKLRKKAQSSSQSCHSIKYDETLLAIIGVLDEVKVQANVSAWIRSGGLWRSRGVEDADTEDEDEEVMIEGEDGIRTNEHDQDDVGLVEESTNNKTQRKPRWRKNKAQKLDEEVDTAESVSTSAPGPVPAENGAVIPAAPSANASTSSMQESIEQSDLNSKMANAEGGQKKAPLWFEDEATLTYWIRRGRKALDELGIEVKHGILR